MGLACLLLLPCVRSAQATVTAATYGETLNDSPDFPHCTPYPNCTSPGSYTVTHTKSSAAAITTSAPGASALYTAETVRNGDDAAGDAGVTYFFEYTGPSSSTLPVDIAYSLDATYTGDTFATGTYSDAFIDTPFGEVDAYCNASVGGCGTGPNYGGHYTLGTTEAKVSSVLSGQVSANTIYQVSVSASGQVDGVENESVYAFADPFIYLDPGFGNADQYSLVLSPGVGNPSPAPEPGTVALSAIAVAITAWVSRRGRRSAA